MIVALPAALRRQLRRTVITTITIAGIAGCSSSDSPEQTGAIKVSVTTTGTISDPDGYSVTIAGGTAQPLTPNGSITVADLDAGSYAVELTGVASPCVVGNANPSTVQVVAGEEAQAVFTVTCAIAMAQVQAVTNTSGSDQDADGYLLSLESLGCSGSLECSPYFIPIASSGASDVQTVPVGGYIAELGGMRGNCHTLERNPSVVNVGQSAGEAAQSISFGVQCSPARQYAFVRGVGSAAEICLQSDIETECTLLTQNAVADSNPAWSPDGSRLAFTSARDGGNDIYVMDADGGNVQRLTNDGVNYQPTWSPDGSHIAFVKEGSFGTDIYVMAADGSGPVGITGLVNCSEPAWSPTGARILFVIGGLFEQTRDIYVMNSDGSAPDRLTSSSGWEAGPTWDPSGNRIAYLRRDPPPGGSLGTGFTVHTMNVDGTGDTDVAHDFTSSPATSTRLSWAPDNHIAFSHDSDCASCSEISAVAPDGTGRNLLFPYAGAPIGSLSQPAWRP